MKKPTRKDRVVPRPLRPSELKEVRGGDDWESPVTLAASKTAEDDWLAPQLG